MSRKFIPVDEAIERWESDPAFVAAYDALGEEFALASALIKAPGDMAQKEPAQAVGTTQAVIARLESGRGKPST